MEKKKPRGITRHGNFASDHSQTHKGYYNVIYTGEDPDKAKVCVGPGGRTCRYASEASAAADARKFHMGEKEAYVIVSGEKTAGGSYSSKLLRVDNGRPPAHGGKAK